jgi:hypothetical protein
MAAAVAVVDSTPAGQAAVPGSGRYAVQPPFSHCWAVSQRTAEADGVMCCESSARRASDWRSTPSWSGEARP